MAHDLGVKFEDTIAEAAAIDLGAWECWSREEGGATHYYAAGPCPGCGAAAQGHIDTNPKPIESLGEGALEGARAGAPVEVPVTCACGHDHGSEGATGCGRRWSILCPGDGT